MSMTTEEIAKIFRHFESPHYPFSRDLPNPFYWDEFRFYLTNKVLPIIRNRFKEGDKVLLQFKQVGLGGGTDPNTMLPYYEVVWFEFNGKQAGAFPAVGQRVLWDPERFAAYVASQFGLEPKPEPQRVLSDPVRVEPDPEKSVGDEVFPGYFKVLDTRPVGSFITNSRGVFEKVATIRGVFYRRKQ